MKVSDHKMPLCMGVFLKTLIAIWKFLHS